MSNVIDLPVITTLPLNPSRVISAAGEQQFKRVLIIGVLEDDSEYFASSEPDGGTVLWDMERAKHSLMRIADASDN